VGNKITLNGDFSNLNWLLKDTDSNMFIGEADSYSSIIKEPETKYQKKIGQEDLYKKLDEILEIKKVTCK
jgi:hypothetical protein